MTDLTANRIALFFRENVRRYANEDYSNFHEIIHDNIVCLITSQTSVVTDDTAIELYIVKRRLFLAS